jgi:hypothetical protein
MTHCANAWLFKPHMTNISCYRCWDADNIFYLLMAMPPHAGFYNVVSGFRRECAVCLNHFSFAIHAEEYKATSIVNAQ